MIVPEKSQRLNWLPLVLLILSGFIVANPAVAYLIDAEILDPNSMIFPVGDLLPDDFSSASEINFQDLPRIFRMRVGDNVQADPDILVLMVRLEVHGGEPIFTVSSNAFDIRRYLVQPYWPRWLDNQELARAPGFTVGEGAEVNKNRLLPFISGNNLVEGMYILTVLLAEDGMSWENALSDNYGIRSETMKAYNPSQVELNLPEDNNIIYGNPTMTWSCPRNPGVAFHLELVGHVMLRANEDWIFQEEEIDPSTALDFVNDFTRFLDTTFTAGPGARGELTSYPYRGTGGERPLEKGRTYFWRVTAEIPSFIDEEIVPIESTPYTFSFGPYAEILGPVNDDQMETSPTFLWYFPPLPDLHFAIEILKGDFSSGTHWATAEIDPGGIEREQWSYSYGSGFNDKALEPGRYSWQIKAMYSADGVDKIAESVPRSFMFIPPLVELSPYDTVIVSKPTFVWSFPYSVPVTKFLLEVQRDGAEFVSMDVSGIQRSVPLSEPLDMGADYQWRIIAVASDDWQQTGDWVQIHFRKPRLVLYEPQYGGVVFSAAPTFRWDWTSPLQAEATVEYHLKVFRAQGDDTTTFADGSISGTLTSWTYVGDNLPADGDFIDWLLEARVTMPSGAEFTQIRNSSFVYETDDDDIIPTLALLEPEDNDTLTSTPELSWSISQLPDDYNLEFVLTVIPDTIGATAEVFELDKNQRTFVYNTEALNDDVTYSWNVLAKYGHPELPLEEVSTEARRFTYQLRGVIEEGFQLRLLASMHGSIPPEMLDLIIQALRSEDVTINSIVVDGLEVDFNNLMDVFLDEKNDFVLINISD
ncbi:MAG: hypothetical protein HQ568_05970 [Calditrichaeota bacterium]|nr:hypothetical protein [Calditrichota bacterium]